MDPFNWTCGYCGHAQTVTGANRNMAVAEIYNRSSTYGPIFGTVHTIACANPNCRELTLVFNLHHRDHPNQINLDAQHIIHSWPLLPESAAKPQPGYIPKSIVNNYMEACRIRDLSPNASAAMSRRCLQGMVRDFWNVKEERNLWFEIQAIKDEDEVHPMTWEAIDAVRKVGNIGAHMEEDVNLILDVEPEEAQALISLIEMLFKDWYVDRHERQKRRDDVIQLGLTKEKQKNAAAGKNSEERSHPKA